MTALDRYTIKLQCPKCQREGVAHASENDGWSFRSGGPQRRVDLPPGFKEVRGDSKQGVIDVLCSDCGVSAWW